MAASPVAITPTVIPTARTQPSTPDEAMRRRVIAGSFIGNFVEWFDYAVYGYFATAISTTFFPNDTPRTALVKTFALFALSFLCRPIGGLVWGHIGDRIGRRPALAASILLMSGASFLIALLPTYDAVGVLAPVLLLVLRLVQGFSAAGEYAGASAYLAEYAPASRRGLTGAVVPASTASGLLVGSLIAAGMSAWMPASDLSSWGWRLPFVLALPLGLVGLTIRRRLDDSPEFIAARGDTQTSETAPIALVLRERRALVVTFAAALLNAVGFYVVLSYLPTYLSTELGLDQTRSFIAATIALGCYIAMVLGAGALSDHYGRKPLMYAASTLFVVGSVPAFIALGSGSFAVVVLVQILLGGVLALNDGVLPSFLAEQFTTRVRFTGFALTFNLANALFGGTAPMIATWLVGRTHWAVAPAAYLVAVAAVTLGAVVLARETAGEPLARD